MIISGLLDNLIIISPFYLILFDLLFHRSLTGK